MSQIAEGHEGGGARTPIGSIRVGGESDIVRVRDRVRLVSKELGFDGVRQIKLTTAVSELTRNIYEYAGSGTIEISLVERAGRMGLEVVCEDSGPGIPNLDDVLEGRFKSESGLGKGLAGSRRLMDEFSITSTVGEGTRVQVIKWLDKGQAPLRSPEEIMQLFFSAGDSGMVEELQAQNQELISVLAELNESRRDLERAIGEFQEANWKLKRVDETKSRFISTIAHEIRTPVNAIIGLAQLLVRDQVEPLAPRHREAVLRLEKSATMLARLVNDLLDLSRLQAGRMQIRVQEFEVADVIDSIFNGLNQTARDKGVRFHCEVQQGIGRGWSDLTKVTQVITNLASNAIKFTPANGEVRIEAHLVRPGFWAVDVSDTGIGISQDQLPLIFEEFRQVNLANPHHGGGTGLGLPISRRLAELLGGRLSVESDSGRGSRFTVLWPLDVRDIVPPASISE